MSPTQKSEAESTSKERCPVTGLPILRRPEWTDVDFGGNLSLTIHMVGDILHARPRGRATVSGVEGCFRLAREVRAATIGMDRYYVEIGDWTGMNGGSIRARKAFIDNIKSNKHMMAIIFFGSSPVLKISLNIAGRFNIMGVDVRVVNSYAQAVALARKILAGRRSPAEDADPAPHLSVREAATGHEVVTHPEWLILRDNFSLKFEIIDGNVLHGSSSGRLREKHVAPCLTLQEKLTRSMGGASTRYWYVLGLSGSEGMSQRARKTYVKAIIALLKKHPLQSFIFYGLSKFMRAAANLSKPFVPFKVRIVKDLDAALALIDNEKLKMLDGAPPPRRSRGDRSKDELLRPYVRELLRFIEGVDWGSDGVDASRTPDPDHPFHPVFEAIELIKWELDDVFRERDRTQRENAALEARLQRARKMEAIGTLAGGVAHDLNNILSGIVGYPELLLMELPEDSPLRPPLSTIRKSGEKAAAIVQDLLTLARRGVPVSEVMNLNDIVSEYLKSPEFKKMTYYHPNVRVESNLSDNLLNILGSPVHLSKTIMNLTSNAAEAMPEGGVLAISTENVHLDAPLDGYEEIRKGDYVVLKVSDTGVGISPKDRERIFEPFYTKKMMGRSGTGLGMAVIWGAVKDLHGYIDVRSAEGKGASFTLYFPVTRKEPRGESSLLSGDALKGHGESILVVDDVEEQRAIASAMLRKLGYSVETASSGEAAIVHLKNKSADLLVLDMIMDPGIDGLETYKKIIEFRPGQKAIIASGFAETDRVREAQSLGAGAYVRKPYTFETIGLAVKTELERVQPGRGKQKRLAASQRT